MTSTSDRAAGRAVLLAAEPQLFVADIEAACRFYRDRLGFAVAFTHGDPPFYGQVVRDGARLNLRCVATPVVDAVRRERESLLSAAITVATRADIDGLFAEFDAAGATFAERLADQPWGARNFIVRDPDGNLVLFAGPAT